MSRKHVFRMFGSMVLLGWCGVALPGENDDRAVPSATGVDEGHRIQIVRLKSTAASEIADTLRRLDLPIELSADRLTNSVIVGGSGEAYQAALRLLGELDAAAGQESGQDQAILELKHRDAGEVAGLVAQTLEARVAHDAARNILVVSGNRSTQAAVRQLVERVDKPSVPLTLTFFFIDGRIDGNAKPADVSGLPEALRPVAAALTKNGFADLSLAAPFTTRVQESAEFHLKGTAESPDGTARDFEIGGEVLQGVDGGTVQFRLTAQAKSEPPLPDRDEASSEHPFGKVGRNPKGSRFSVETVVSVRLGEYVVLSASPNVSGDRTALALVVRAEQG